MSSSQAHNVRNALTTILANIQSLAAKHNRTHPINLLAVSKTKPVDSIKEAYDAGQIHFGENYVNELLEKYQHCPADIKWHFIGHLQTNKVAKLACVPNLYQVESIDSLRLAEKLSNAWKAYGPKPTKPLRVCVQVNTSHEASKSGCRPEECVELVKSIHEKCDGLKVVGLMTIGSLDESVPPRDCFSVLTQLKKELETAVPSLFEGKSGEDAESKDAAEPFVLSMGMSGDYEDAIACGSTQIRIGTAIFGARSYVSKGAKEEEAELAAAASGASTEDGGVEVGKQ